jgi:hypothetical protein
MHRRIWVLTLLAMTGVAACDLTDVDEVVRTQAQQYPLQATWTASLTPLPGVAGAQVSGNLTMGDYKTYYDGQIALSGGLPNTTYNWRIYLGTCDATTTTIAGGTTGAFPALVTNAAGAASATRQFPSFMSLRQVQSYNVRILTGTALATTIACGALQLTS